VGFICRQLISTGITEISPLVAQMFIEVRKMMRAAEVCRRRAARKAAARVPEWPPPAEHPASSGSAGRSPVRESMMSPGLPLDRAAPNCTE
jgi:hypothetical protein